MESHATDAGPDPTRVVTLDDLSRELNLLRARAARGTRSARVSLDDLARRVDEPKSTIHAYVAGLRMPPAQVLDRIVIAMGASSREQREWAEAWYRVGAHRQSSRRGGAEARPRDEVPHQLPSAVDDFVGRTAQLRYLDELVGRGQVGTLVAICGTAGVGKTALAVRWAQARAAWFPDGQLHVDLGGYGTEQPMPPGQALARMLRALGVPNRQIARELDERATQLRSMLSGRRVLVLLDNARDTEQVRSLLPGAPSCTLVTSRDSLSGLVARHGAHRIELDVLPLGEATELLHVLIGGEHSGSLHEASSATLVTLAEQCAQLPLALRIAAEMASSRPEASLTELIDSLVAGQCPLDVLDAGDDPRTALRPVLSWSYRQLSEQAAQAFRLIGLLPGSEVTEEGLAALVDATVFEARRLLEALVHAHLLRQVAAGRYGMHGLLRAYARELTLDTDPPAVREEALSRLRDQHRRNTVQSIPAPRPVHRRRFSDPEPVDSRGDWLEAGPR